MTQASQASKGDRGTLFGVPVGNLGWFASLLMSLAAGFIAFFAATFVGIFSILLYNATTHHSVDLALSYRRGGLLAGILVLLLSLAFLGTQWVRRIARKA